MAQQKHKIKAAGDGLARQATKAIRAAGLVDESTVDGEMGEGRDVIVYGFDGLLMAVDVEHVSKDDRAELVSSAAADTGSIHLGQRATVSVRGNGYQVYLPGCEAAGLYEGNKAATTAADGVLLVYSPGDSDAARLAEDLWAIRDEQTK
mgnify:FL=1